MLENVPPLTLGSVGTVSGIERNAEGLEGSEDSIMMASYTLASGKLRGARAGVKLTAEGTHSMQG